jgi:hypothetical protein
MVDEEFGGGVRGTMAPTQQAIWDTCNGLFFELNNEPKKAVDLISGCLVSAMDENLKILNRGKGKKVEVNKKKDLALNISYLYAVLGGKLSCAEKSVLPQIISHIFSFYGLSKITEIKELKNGSSGSEVLKALCEEERQRLLDSNETKTKINNE